MKSRFCHRALLNALSFGLCLWAGYFTDLLAEPVDEARDAVTRWVAIERAISSESVAWQEKRALLKDLIAVGESEREVLREEISRAEQSASQADQRRSRLVTERAALDRARERVTQFLQKQAPRLQALRKKLPKPLQDSLAADFANLLAKSDAEAATASGRMQALVAILDRIQKFNDVITVSEEVRPLADGAEGLVTTVYIGLGTAYYLSESDGDCGRGHPTENGWEWVSVPEIKPALERVLEMVEGQSTVPQFESLPFQIVE